MEQDDVYDLDLYLTLVMHTPFTEERVIFVSAPFRLGSIYKTLSIPSPSTECNPSS